MNRAIPIVLGVIAVATLANAAWMIIGPEHWYLNVPAEVPDFGPYNSHLVRDFGIGFLMIGLGLLWGLRVPSVRPTTVAFGAMFYGFHAATHIFDTGRGHVHAEHWLLDLPTTYLPAILLVAIWWRIRDQRAT